MIVNASARLTKTICCKVSETLNFIIQVLCLMQNANDYTKVSFYNEIELVHIFISDFHAFEKKLFCNQELVTKKYKLFVCWITIVE